MAEEMKKLTGGLSLAARHEAAVLRHGRAVG